MKHALSESVASESARTPKRQSVATSAALWVVQGLLALLFLLTGAMNLFQPLAEALARMPLPLPGLFVRFIGVFELAGALGLILPGLLRIRPRLMSLAATGLLLEMIGATVVNLLGGKGDTALIPVATGLLCAVVAYGRRSWSQTKEGA